MMLMSNNDNKVSILISLLASFCLANHYSTICFLHNILFTHQHPKEKINQDIGNVEALNWLLGIYYFVYRIAS